MLHSAGPTFSDRHLAGEVRNLALSKIKDALENPETSRAFYNALLLRLAGSVLPRLNEVTGEDGSEIKINIVDYGNYNPTQLETGESSTLSSAGQIKIQSSDVASESTQNDFSDK